VYFFFFFQIDVHIGKVRVHVLACVTEV